MPIYYQYYIEIVIWFFLIILFAGWLIKNVELPWIFKVIFVTILLFSAILIPKFQKLYFGLPVVTDFDELPKQFELLDVRDGADSRIYIWIVAKNDYIPQSLDILPSKTDRKILENANKALKQGQQIFIDLTPPKESGTGIATDSNEESASSKHFEIIVPKFQPKEN